ncbi:hypothetical protein MELA_02900 [Candidatus Methylomirabilis lanthanidiphila]|uniref:Uncharacterized protein n=1 Tax=Candidatus Methylomirabilis lanthanidiphila TaxID=2211376 RepID=A0A564ZNR7_9BACT|nr:hypothetical protein MELA_02900 [Candidatus Methylomirabilis lanthanidiphila]
MRKPLFTVDCPENANLLSLSVRAGTVEELAQQWGEEME